MPRPRILLPLLVAALVAVAGCGLPGLPGVGDDGSSGGAALWPDVPALPGSAPVDVQLPLPVRMLVKTFVNAAGSGGNGSGGNGSDSGGDANQESKDWDFKVYQAAGSGTDIGSFYSQDQMSANGWTRGEASCGASSPIPNGSLCLFTKQGADGFTDNLAIVLMPGEGDGGNDQVAYVRFSTKG